MTCDTARRRPRFATVRFFVWRTTASAIAASSLKTSPRNSALAPPADGNRSTALPQACWEYDELPATLRQLYTPPDAIRRPTFARPRTRATRLMARVSTLVL